MIWKHEYDLSHSHSVFNYQNQVLLEHFQMKFRQGVTWKESDVNIQKVI